METKKTIYTKLLEFQKLEIVVNKDGKNDFFKKDGKASKYTTLNEVLDKVKKPLNDMGVLIIFTPEENGLRTILLDIESDTKVESFMKYVGIDNAQKLLACNTYFRRGSLISLLGLEDEDDDGNKASAPSYKPAVAPKPAPKPVKKPTAYDSAQNAIEKANTVETLDPVLAQIGESKRLTEEEKEKLIEVGSMKRDSILFELSQK